MGSGGVGQEAMGSGGVGQEAMGSGAVARAPRAADPSG